MPEDKKLEALPERLAIDGEELVYVTKDGVDFYAKAKRLGGGGVVPSRVFFVDGDKDTSEAKGTFKTLQEAWDFATTREKTFVESPVAFQIIGGVGHTLIATGLDSDHCRGFAILGRTHAAESAAEIASLEFSAAGTELKIELRDVRVTLLTAAGTYELRLANAAVETLSRTSANMVAAISGTNSRIGTINANAVDALHAAGHGSISGTIDVNILYANGAAGAAGDNAASPDNANGAAGDDGADGTFEDNNGSFGAGGQNGGDASGLPGNAGTAGSDGGDWVIERGAIINQILANGGNGGNGGNGSNGGQANGGPGGKGGDGYYDGTFHGSGGDGGRGGDAGVANGGAGGAGGDGGKPGSMTIRYGACVTQLYARRGTGGTGGTGGSIGTATGGAGGTAGTGESGPATPGDAGNDWSSSPGNDGATGSTTANATQVGPGGMLLSIDSDDAPTGDAFCRLP